MKFSTYGFLVRKLNATHWSCLSVKEMIFTG